MKKMFASALVVLFAVVTSAASVAEAKRLGGGGSFGKKSAPVNRQATPPAQQNTAPAQPAAPAAAPAAAGAAGTAAAASSRSKWLGPVAGIAAGLGLAALFSSLGLGDELASLLGSLLMVALLVMAGLFLWRMLRGAKSASERTPQPAYAGRMMGPNTLNGLGNEGSANPLPSAPVKFEPSSPVTATAPASHAPASAQNAVPSDFDSEAFLRNAKVYFVRLQAAWDAGNLNDIREFTSPEMFAEISLQVQERGPAPNQTDVVTLNAELLGVETSAVEHLASVRFYGMIREQIGAPAESFDEVWNLSKPVAGNTGWVLAGIQQVGLVH
jgi:predicted lipid-binding transport protein (Tim44 family)